VLICDTFKQKQRKDELLADQNHTTNIQELGTKLTIETTLVVISKFCNYELVRRNGVVRGQKA